MQRIARHVFVSGRVQGVGFRWFVTSVAKELELTGWVRNLEDGRVEAWLEGEERAVDDALARIRRGKAGAHVDALENDAREPKGLRDFGVQR